MRRLGTAYRCACVDLRCHVHIRSTSDSEVVMVKRSILIASVITLVTACSSPAPTGPVRQAMPLSRDVQSDAPASSPGIPGTPNCRGQTTRFLAQGEGGLVDTHGIGCIARAAELS